MDMSLSEDQEAVRKAVRTWVDDVVVPRALQNDREERFPQEALDGLAETGFVGLTVPEQYGGGGADPLTYVLLVEELGRGDANVARSSACTWRWSPARSTRGAPRSRRPAGCRRWPPGRCSAASG
jgi:alkylation response protein AidB-like acyl-CoA dehydrogenase